ncbi:L-lactate permease [Amycolatopsis sp. FDAARGOS 1241]|uniref:L-lactate permease n=1 Tax=Amycolatopsis sp. FDAARGOS 1241 TaxID=2778070 RepID=UPI00195134F7|nr:L-lactate permease [Amycolatopsis sp. FDAARGOS 1241]QRP50207.1 L-lactate permease [Amycolatopsis sp. FDAARGOS 1241]
MFTQILVPVGGSLTLSALLAAVPLLLLIVLLGVFKTPARIAAPASLIAALAVGVVAFRLPASIAFSGAAEGIVYGIFPILWVAINAIWLHKVTELRGHSAALRTAFTRVSDDRRVQAILVAFCFGAALEGLAGGGAPVAICAVILMALGLSPIKAAAACLIADTSPVAFGALGQPIDVLATQTGLPVPDLAVMIGRQTPVLALFIPLVLVLVVDGKTGLKQRWGVALAAGVSFAAVQCAASVFLTPALVDTVAAVVSGVVTVLVARAGRVPATAVRRRTVVAAGGGASGGSDFAAPPADESTVDEKRPPVFAALAPYLLIVAVVVLANLPGVSDLIASLTTKVHWPGVDVGNSDGEPLSIAKISFAWVGAPGSLVLIAGLLSLPVLGVGLGRATRVWLANLWQLRWAIFTVCCVIALSYVMNLSGQTTTLGVWLAGAGAAFPLVSPVIGWIGTVLTGSDTSSNTLFGLLQYTTAHHAGLSDVLLTSANSSGGVVGKAVSLQNLAIAAVAVGLGGKEGVLFRRTIGWTVVMVVVLSVLVYLQSTPVLGWLVP